MADTRVERSKIAHVIRWLAVPIVLGWIALTARAAPSFIAIKRVEPPFEEFDSDANAMIVLEGDKPLGADAHQYYDGLVHKLAQDTRHVEHIQDFWGDPLTAAGAQ